MKVGRNELCPCGSSKKYKYCCGKESLMGSDFFAGIEDLISKSPSDYSLDDLNRLLHRNMDIRNNTGLDEFCGLSPNQMQNWLHMPFDKLKHITITIPKDLSRSPVMRYLEIILEEAMAQGGSIKATPKGNLPTSIVKRAAAVRDEFEISKLGTHISICEFKGSNEDKFEALHYTHVLAKLSGILYKRTGRIHVKKSAQKQYQEYGINALFLPMLKTAVTNYNWGYFDGYSDEVVLQTFWVFMV